MEAPKGRENRFPFPLIFSNFPAISVGGVRDFEVKVVTLGLGEMKIDLGAYLVVNECYMELDICCFCLEFGLS